MKPGDGSAQDRGPIRVDAGGVVLAVTSSGPAEAPPVVVLHGFTGSATAMQGVNEMLGEVYRVVAIDLVGHGESDAPGDPSLYTMANCVSQVLGVLDALGIRRAHFVGYSMGGRVALSLAVAQPTRAASLVLVGVSPGEGDSAARAARVEADESLAQAILDGGIEGFVDRWMALPLFASQSRLGKQALAAARSQRLGCRPEGLAHSLRGMGSGAMPPLHGRLGELDVPVLLVAGAEDAKFCALAETLREALPRAEVRVIPEAGHAAHLEQPAAFAAGCLTFLGAVEAEVGARSTPASLSSSTSISTPTPTPTDVRSSPGEKRLP